MTNLDFNEKQALCWAPVSAALIAWYWSMFQDMPDAGGTGLFMAVFATAAAVFFPAFLFWMGRRYRHEVERRRWA